MNSFKIGEWIIEPELDRVKNGSDQISLQPQVMQLLVFLAQHQGEVISIDEMIESVWQGKPMTSGSVYNSLNAIRKAFDDNPKQPRYIETIPTKGYRLITPVSFIEADIVATNVQSGNLASSPLNSTMTPVPVYCHLFCKDRHLLAFGNIKIRNRSFKYLGRHCNRF